MRLESSSTEVAITACALALVVGTLLPPMVHAQYWPGGQQGQAQQGQGQSVSGRLLQRLNNNIQADKQAKAAQDAKKKAEQDAYQAALRAGLCPPPPKTTEDPTQRGKSDSWRNLTNMMHKLPNGVSANMGGNNNAFQNHMGAERAGTFETGGSKLTSVDDSIGHSRYTQVNGNAGQTSMSGADFAKSIGGRIGN